MADEADTDETDVFETRADATGTDDDAFETTCSTASGRGRPTPVFPQIAVLTSNEVSGSKTTSVDVSSSDGSLLDDGHVEFPVPAVSPAAPDECPADKSVEYEGHEHEQRRVGQHGCPSADAQDLVDGEV